MRNPWALLPKTPPYVLEIDRPAIDAFNRSASDDHRIRPEIVPEPFLGNPRAPVVLLNLNPGFVHSDEPVHENGQFNAAACANLEHRHDTFPFYLLDPRLPASPGRTWWMKKLRALIAATDLETVANRVFVIEVHGYHSRRFSPGVRLPSQAYTRDLALSALARGAEIVVMRGVRHWMTLVPELGNAESVSVVRNVQNPTISLGNLGTFDRIPSAVRSRQS